MGIRIYELAKQLGMASKDLVDKCAELLAEGSIGKEVKTASSSLDAADEAVVRQKLGAAAPEQAGASATQAAPAPSPVRLVQSHARKLKGKSPTQLARPQTPQPQPVAPATTEAAKPEPPKPSTPTQEPAPTPQQPKAEVRTPALPETEPPEPTAEEPPQKAKVQIAALPGFKPPPEPEPAPEPAEPEPEAKVPALPGFKPPSEKPQAPEAESAPQEPEAHKPEALAPQPTQAPAPPAPPKPRTQPPKAAPQPSAPPDAHKPRPAKPTPPAAKPKPSAPQRKPVPSPTAGKVKLERKVAPPTRTRPLRPAPPPRRRSDRLRPIPKTAAARPRPIPKDRKIIIQPPITIKEFSQQTGIKANDIIRRLMKDQIMATINEVIAPEVAGMIGLEFGLNVELKKARDVEDDLLQLLVDEAEEQTGEPQPRAPIVTLLGHVDHGKTSLLDRIRQTHVAEGESGGITQHIGAYQVKTGDRYVTFLDTPGHEAFTAMRARGANVTDVVVLVVAADDGVMPQTEEAVNHARAADVPIVVAINKVDKSNANVMRAKQQLSALGLMPEEWGGETQVVEVSALTGQGIEDLLEMLALESDLLELKADPVRNARGALLEAERTPGRGVEATLLVQEGTLRPGDIILCGTAHGRVRSLISDKGKPLASAGPAMPVAVSGLSGVPSAGDAFNVVKDLQKAKTVAEERERRSRIASLAQRQHVTLETLFEHIEQGKVHELRIVLRADVQGSVEVLESALQDLGTDEVKPRILHSAVGGITESDVLLADASDAVVIGFHVTPDDRARSLADEKGVDIRLYQVIYNAIGDVKKAMEGMLEPEEREKSLGRAEVLRVFRISRIGSIAGCAVRDGLIRRSARVRLSRDNVSIYTGRLQSLRIEKDDVREVRSGQECGIKIDGFDDVKEGDIIEAFEVQHIARTIDS